MYLLAFNLERINSLLQGGTTLLDMQNLAKEDESQQIMIIEFLGGKLSSCSDLIHLHGNSIFYGSASGDSYQLQLESEEGCVDVGINPPLDGALNHRPYVRIVEEQQSLAPVNGMEMRTGLQT